MTPAAIGQFQITGTIGAGGMGEVFRARDTRLNREVAVKVLPKAFASHPDRLRRFEQEAKTLAALNHPNILTIHDTGVHEGAPYLVSELLEGQTLREALGGASGTPLPVRKAIEYSLQIANGLAAAHSNGVIHRDLKPENIFITKDGRVKLLDFGLAKLQALHLQSQISNPTSPPDDAAPTILETTQPGIVLGTPAYMSPEQARGEPADHRADIFAFGCVLYETLSGKSAFRKETAVQTMHAILSEEPVDLGECSPGVSPALERIVRRCLEKAPMRRFQSTTDLAFAIENAGPATSSLSLRPGKAPFRSRVDRVLPWAVATCAVALGLAAWFGPRRGSPEPPQPVGGPGAVRKFELSLGPMRTSAGVDPVISPDGQKLAYAGADGLWVRRLDRLEPPTLLAGGDSIAAPFWSPTSTEIAFFEKRKLYRVAITGGRPVLVTATLEDATSTPAGGAWLDDGQIAFTTGPRCALHAVPSSGGAATNLVSLADGEWDFHNASPLPKGRGVLFVVHRNHPYGVDTLAVWTPGGGRKVLLQLPGSDLGRPVFSPTGHVVFHREDESPGIWAFRFSLQTLERTGDLFRVSDSGRRPSVANDGTLVFSVNSLDQFAPRQLTWVDRSGKVLNTVSQPLPGLRAQRLSPDGTRVAAVVGESRAGLDIWIFDIEGGGAVAFTRNESAEMLAGWQSDGRSIVFTRRGETGSQVLAREVTGAGQEEVLFDGIVWHLSRTGRYLLATQKAPDGTRVPAIRGYVPMKERPLRIVAYPQAFQNVRFPVLSPDDRLLAYQSEDSGQMEVYLVDFPGFNTVKSVVSRSGGWHPQWNPNGTELFFLDRDGRALMSAKVRPDGRFTEEPKQLFKLSDSIPGAHAESWPCFYDVAPDGQRFLMVRSAQNASPAAGAARTDALLVQNWIEEFPGKK